MNRSRDRRRGRGPGPVRADVRFEAFVMFGRRVHGASFDRSMSRVSETRLRRTSESLKKQTGDSVPLGAFRSERDKLMSTPATDHRQPPRDGTRDSVDEGNGSRTESDHDDALKNESVPSTMRAWIDIR
jgi:hypothetical protein